MARHKEFDHDEVLDRAVQVFWQRGYEGTSISDLTDALGIGRQSLYDTFGDKHAVYLAALDRYMHLYGGAGSSKLTGAAPVRREIRSLMQWAIDGALSRPVGQTCFVINAAAERCGIDDEVAKRTSSSMLCNQTALTARLTTAIKTGEIASHHDPAALARYFVNALAGLQITAKSVRDRATLEQIADTTVSILG